MISRFYLFSGRISTSNQDFAAFFKCGTDLSTVFPPLLLYPSFGSLIIIIISIIIRPMCLLCTSSPSFGGVLSKSLELVTVPSRFPMANKASYRHDLTFLSFLCKNFHTESDLKRGLGIKEENHHESSWYHRRT